MAKSKAYQCTVCQTKIPTTDFRLPQVCADCLRGMRPFEIASLNELAQIKEYLRHSAIMAEHQQSDDNQVARLAKAMERMLVEYKAPMAMVTALMVEIRDASIAAKLIDDEKRDELPPSNRPSSKN